MSLRMKRKERKVDITATFRGSGRLFFLFCLSSHPCFPSFPTPISGRIKRKEGKERKERKERTYSFGLRYVSAWTHTACEDPVSQRRPV